MKKSYKNIYYLLLLTIPSALMSMLKGPDPLNNTDGLEIRKNQMEDGSKGNQYYQNNILQFSLIQNPEGLVKVAYESAGDQNVEFILRPLSRDALPCRQRYNFAQTPEYFYTASKKGSQAQERSNITTFYDPANLNLRLYSIKNFGNSTTERFYEPSVVALDPTMLKDSNKSFKDKGIKLQIDKNKNGNKIETLYYIHMPVKNTRTEGIAFEKDTSSQEEPFYQNIDVIKFYSQTGSILFELVINNNDYTAELTTYNTDKKLMTHCYQIEDISGITTDFHRDKKIFTNLSAKLPRYL